MKKLSSITLAAITSLLERRGYRVDLRGYPPRGFPDFLRFASRCGIEPRTVYDIGVGRGTQWLYDAFPSAGLVLVEALESFRPHLDRIVAERGAKLHVTALGSATGRMRMHVPTIEHQSASLHARAARFDALLEASRGSPMQESSVDVDVVTLDSIVTEEPPYLLKLDVEGSEIDVLAGGTRTLKRTDLVIMEMSVLDRYDGEPNFAERIAWMDRHGFRLFDIPVLSQTSAEGPLSNIDAAFVRKDRELAIPGL